MIGVVFHRPCRQRLEALREERLEASMTVKDKREAGTHKPMGT